MFTGIIESIGTLRAILEDGTNKRFYIHSKFFREVKIDQSIAHNGICLTVEGLGQDDTFYHHCYSVVAIEETLNRTNLGKWRLDDQINLERCLTPGSRLDGHFVQGHVDDLAIVQKIENRKGSWNFYFSMDPTHKNLIVKKGSITLNGVSLTVVEAGIDYFSVSIIPYTYNNTNFKNLSEGSNVNIEFDILGKYVNRIMENKKRGRKSQSK